MTTTEPRWPDLAGRIVEDANGRRHVLPIRVYFEDTDFSGLVYHGSYVRWCERGRSDFLRLLGNTHRGLIDGGGGREPAAFVVRRMALEFLKPARIDEVLEVTTRAKALAAAALTLDQTIARAGLALFQAEVTVVLVSRDRVASCGCPRRCAKPWQIIMLLKRPDSDRLVGLRVVVLSNCARQHALLGLGLRFGAVLPAFGYSGRAHRCRPNCGCSTARRQPAADIG